MNFTKSAPCFLIWLLASAEKTFRLLLEEAFVARMKFLSLRWFVPLAPDFLGALVVFLGGASSVPLLSHVLLASVGELVIVSQLTRSRCFSLPCSRGHDMMMDCFCWEVTRWVEWMFKSSGSFRGVFSGYEPRNLVWEASEHAWRGRYRCNPCCRSGKALWVLLNMARIRICFNRQSKLFSQYYSMNL